MSKLHDRFKLDIEQKITEEIAEKKWENNLISYKIESEWAFLKNHYPEEKILKEHIEW